MRFMIDIKELQLANIKVWQIVFCILMTKSMIVSYTLFIYRHNVICNTWFIMMAHNFIIDADLNKIHRQRHMIKVHQFYGSRFFCELSLQPNTYHIKWPGFTLKLMTLSSNDCIKNVYSGVGREWLLKQFKPWYDTR